MTDPAPGTIVRVWTRSLLLPEGSSGGLRRLLRLWRVGRAYHADRALARARQQRTVAPQPPDNPSGRIRRTRASWRGSPPRAWCRALSWGELAGAAALPREKTTSAHCLDVNLCHESAQDCEDRAW